MNFTTTLQNKPMQPKDLILKALELFPKSKPASDFFVKFCQESSIDTPLRVSHFFAQLAHESGEFQYIKELGNDKYFDKYDTGKIAANLGNTPEKDGDGAKYKGRGYIQVTGAANVKAASLAKFGDTRLLKDPTWLETVEGAAWSAVWFWTSRKLNTLADKDDVLGITKKINGGTNGLEDRKLKLKKIKDKLGI